MNIKNFTVGFIKWQMSKAWKSSICLFIIGILVIVSIWIDAFSDINLENIFSILFLLQMLFIIFCFFRFIFIKSWLNVFLICIINFFTILFFLLIGLFSIFMIGMIDYDTFADNLKLPENIELKVPISYNPFEKHDKIPKESFQLQVINALGKGSRMADSKEIKIPAIEKLMESEIGRKKLKNYLQAHPEWNLQYSTKKGTYATRNFFKNDGTIDSSEFHCKFPIYNTRTKKYTGEHYQFMFYISLDGKPWAKSKKTYENGKYYYRSSYDANGANVTIYDESKYSGRQMTVKMLELAEKEFTELKLPKNSAKQESFKLFNGMQGGMYIMKVTANPGEPGTIWIEAKEITTQTPLSVSRLSRIKNKIFGSNKKNEFYTAEIKFTIYEGNWEQYYGANIKVKFQPDNGGEVRTIHEDNYKIEGWMR